MIVQNFSTSFLLTDCIYYHVVFVFVVSFCFLFRFVRYYISMEGPTAKLVQPN